ncbi:phosphotransferase family protein [Aestuariibius insulae]|uniref:phosphotransferase family protein n=1 Tax=Aestuariibius insulae TaxID=2058287 RepID=UPI00345E475E
MQETDIVIRALRAWVKMAKSLRLRPDAFAHTVVTERHQEQFSWCVLRLEDGQQTFYIKKFVGDRSDTQLRRILTAISAAKEALEPLSNLEVVDVVAVQEKAAAILTSSVDGMLLSSFDPVEQLGKAAYLRTGAWLKGLHRQTTEQPEDINFRQVERNLNRCADVIDIAYASRFQALSRETRDLLEDLSLAWVPRSRIHGDAHAGNFLIQGQTVTAIDLERVALSYPAMDLANIVVTSVMEKGCEPRDVMDPLAEGYAPSGDVLQTLPLFLRLALLRRWSRLSQTRILTDRGALRWMDRLLFLRSKLGAVI